MPGGPNGPVLKEEEFLWLISSVPAGRVQLKENYTETCQVCRSDINSYIST